MKFETIFDVITVPTIFFTRNSKYKLIRAFGVVAAGLMIPWSIVALILIVCIGLFLDAQQGIKEWWREV